MTDRRTNLPPGPRTHPALQLFRYTLGPGPVLEGCARRYGDPFTARFAGYGTFVMLSAPEAVRDVFRGDPHELHSGEGNEFLKTVVGDNSVLVLDDEAHARQRRVLLPPLKGERLRAFFEVMKAETEQEVARWPVGRPFRIDEPMRDVTLRVILQAVLGMLPGPELDELAARVKRMMDIGSTRFGLILNRLVPAEWFKGSRWLPFFRHQRAVDDLLFALLARRRAAPGVGADVVADLLTARHEDGKPLSDQEIRDAVLTVLLAGHDTTAVSLAWAFEQLLPRPDVMDRVLSELRQVTGGELRAEHLPKLEYLDAAVRESLRLRNVVPFVVRLLKAPFAAGGREYPAGVHLCPCLHLTHRRPDVYPEPEQFRPERFLGERRPAPNEWYPFGGGNRACLGMAFALYEMKVVLATVFSRVRPERPPGSESRVVRRGILMAPHDGVRVILREHLS